MATETIFSPFLPEELEELVCVADAYARIRYRDSFIRLKMFADEYLVMHGDGAFSHDGQILTWAYLYYVRDDYLFEKAIIVLTL